MHPVESPPHFASKYSDITFRDLCVKKNKGGTRPRVTLLMSLEDETVHRTLLSHNFFFLVRRNTHYIGNTHTK